MFKTCELFGTGIIPWSPLARGFLTRPHRDQNNTERAKSDPNFAKFVGLGNKVEEEALQQINEACVRFSLPPRSCSPGALERRPWPPR